MFHVLGINPFETGSDPFFVDVGVWRGPGPGAETEARGTEAEAGGPRPRRGDEAGAVAASEKLSQNAGRFSRSVSAREPETRSLFPKPGLGARPPGLGTGLG